MITNKEIIVSVCMITYGHECYIKQAIESVLMQKVDFKVELVVADDCSTDKTNSIVNFLKDNYPNGNWIQYTRHEQNKGMMPNFMWALKQCRGKYIALCEGDDYWTDPFKLQKQVDFLEKNLDYNICFHRVNILKNGKQTLHNIPQPYDKMPFYYINLLENHNFITTASTVFRNKQPFTFPTWLKEITFGDLALYKLVSKNKKIKCLHDVMGVYRVHKHGIWSGLSPLKAQKKYLDFYKIIYPRLNSDEKQVIDEKIIKICYKISKLKYPKQPWLQKLYNVYLRAKV